MTRNIDEVKNRLTKALTLKNMKPIELSQKTNIPKSSISQYMSGYSKPNSERTLLICQALDISEAWLLGFDVPMDRNFLPNESKIDENNLIKIGYSLLDDTDKGIIKGEIRQMLRADKYKGKTAIDF